MMRGLPPAARLACLAVAGCVLLLAVAHAGSGASPYAPNEWLFSHVQLAKVSLESGRIPLNADLLQRNTFGDSFETFRHEVGVPRPSFYATTMWHFWNGLPLQPALLATLTLLSGGDPESAARVPLGGFLLVLLTFASAHLLLARRPGFAWHALAPLLVPLASAPLVLDVRVLMPSTSLVAVALVFHLLLRRLVAQDRRALGLAVVPLLLLPFWYYTVSYFVILLFAGFAATRLAAKLRRAQVPTPVPWGLALAVPLLLGGALFLNGAFGSQLQMAQQLGVSPLLGTDAGGDYASHLNRQPWRSTLVYGQGLLLFLPLAWVALVAALRLLAGRRVEAHDALFGQWTLGGAAFTALLLGTLGVSFLNRTLIYLAPVAVLAALHLLSRWRAPAAATAAALGTAALLVTTPLIVATASPTYGPGDGEAYGWLGGRVRHDAIVYSSLEVSSVLLRDHGFVNVIAFQPRQELLRDFWYGTQADATVPYLASFDWFVLRDAVRTTGFMEFGPLRQPVGDAAYAKFAASRDLQLVFDNGANQVFHVALQPERLEERG